MSMKKNTDLTKIIKEEHYGNWIALSPSHDKVIAYSKKLVDLSKKVANKKVSYMKIPPAGVLYAF